MSEELRPRNLEPEQHTVTVEVALGLHHPERLGELLAAMSAHVEVLGSPVGAELAQRVIGVTVTVKATTERRGSLRPNGGRSGTERWASA